MSDRRYCAGSFARLAQTDDIDYSDYLISVAHPFVRINAEQWAVGGFGSPRLKPAVISLLPAQLRCRPRMAASQLPH